MAMASSLVAQWHRFAIGGGCDQGGGNPGGQGGLAPGGSGGGKAATLLSLWSMWVRQTSS